MRFQSSFIDDCAIKVALNGECWQRWLRLVLGLLVVFGAIALIFVLGPEAYSQARLPGTDASDKLEAAGTLLRLIDTGLFKWGARIFAGICIMSAAWALKEQRFGIAIICIVGAIIFGTAPTWVKNIFDIGGGDSVFSSLSEAGAGVAYA